MQGLGQVMNPYISACSHRPRGLFRSCDVVLSSPPLVLLVIVSLSLPGSLTLACSLASENPTSQICWLRLLQDARKSFSSSQAKSQLVNSLLCYSFELHKIE